MRESFVFHADFIDHLPDELKTEWAMYCINYGLYEIEPQFENVLIAELWRKLKCRIDTDRESYNKRVEYQKAYYERKKNNSTVKNIENVENVKNIDNVYPYTESDTNSRREYDYESVSEYEYDSESEYESVSDIVSDALKEQMPTKATTSQSKYCKEIFNLFKDAGLPCAKNNEISFMQTDFKNALSFMHKSPELANIHSDDVIGAVRNYITVYQDSESYITTKMNFFSFVKSKLFYNLLPSNFDINNYKKFGIQKSDDQEDSKPVEHIYITKACPQCNESKLFYLAKSSTYICDGCFAQFTAKEIGE